MKKVLVVGGTDSSGGAGLSRDIQTLASLGVGVVPVVSAVTAQTNAEVKTVELMPAALVRAQLDCAFHDNDIGAIKIGMLGSLEIVETVAQALAKRAKCVIILDPVIAASSGRRLLDRSGLNALKTSLLPLCDLITPNLVESAQICDQILSDEEDKLGEQVAYFHKLGAKNILIKGGHGTSEFSIDRLYDAKGDCVRLAQKRIRTNMRGTGCLLASAIAGHIALGKQLGDAVKLAQSMVQISIYASAQGRVH